MRESRRKFTVSFKAKVAIFAIKKQQTIQELASQYELLSKQINAWKKKNLSNAELVFQSEKTAVTDNSVEKKERYSKIGELQVEVDFLKKVLGK